MLRLELVDKLHDVRTLRKGRNEVTFVHVRSRAVLIGILELKSITPSVCQKSPCLTFSLEGEGNTMRASIVDFCSSEARLFREARQFVAAVAENKLCTRRYCSAE